MKNFKEWLKEKDTELYEGILKGLANNKLARKILTAGAIAGAGYGLTKKLDLPNRITASYEEDEDDEDSLERKHAKLLAAAKRAGVPRSEWNNLEGSSRGGVVITVNGRKVPLTIIEKEEVEDAIKRARRMGNNW
jgi:hypothetical protein